MINATYWRLARAARSHQNEDGQPRDYQQPGAAHLEDGVHHAAGSCVRGCREGAVIAPSQRPEDPGDPDQDREQAQYQSAQQVAVHSGSAPVSSFQAVATTVRTFIAIDMPDGQRASLAAHLQECARIAPGYRWVPTERLHLTLRFLGHIEPDVVDQVRIQLGSVAASPFRVGLDRRGTFGSRSAPRVVWLGVGEGLEECRALARAVEEACQTAGLEPEARGFRGHVTLARQKIEGAPLPELPDVPELDPWRVREFVLYESRLGSRPQYVPLIRYALR